MVSSVVVGVLLCLSLGRKQIDNIHEIHEKIEVRMLYKDNILYFEPDFCFVFLLPPTACLPLSCIISCSEDNLKYFRTENGSFCSLKI